MADQKSDSVIDTPFDAALSERYLVYALSTITARSLPDVRDGLKPVHRRSCGRCGCFASIPAGAFKKSARVVGDVIGKYHPHGDQSVYDAMVRLAQDFALRYPLVDGQGNFGNIDGDNAAAYRYTEARLTAVAMQLMSGVDEGTVDFRRPTTGKKRSRRCSPACSPTCSPTAPAGSRSGWRRPSRRTMSAS
jgi:topoisomerase IV subunit A